MPAPQMVIAAGPSGGGKSTVFRVIGLDVDAFNVDDCAARLNAARLGSAIPVYQGIPPAVRNEARESMRNFIEQHLAERRSFAFETTLRDVTSSRFGALPNWDFRCRWVSSRREIWRSTLRVSRIVD